MANYNFILASASPRRRELLSIYVDNFKIIPADIDETIPNNINIKEAPLYIAKKKAEAVKHNILDNDILITADTIVMLEDRVYGKPKNKQDAFNMIKTLSNKEHSVITGVCCYSGDNKINIEFNDTTYVTFNNLDDNIINSYLNYDEYKDKAGGYAVQGIASFFVKKIMGSYDNVVGLPMGRLFNELLKCNINILK